MKTVSRTLKAVGVLLAGGALLATGGCAITSALQQLLQGILPGTGQ